LIHLTQSVVSFRICLEVSEDKDAKREAVAKARRAYLQRKRRWAQLVSALEEKTLKLATDDTCDLIALARLASIVVQCRDMKRRERDARYSQRVASGKAPGTMTDVPTNGTGNRCLTPETLADIEVLAKLM
jgi:hypothetical protein